MYSNITAILITWPNWVLFERECWHLRTCCIWKVQIIFWELYCWFIYLYDWM